MTLLIVDASDGRAYSDKVIVAGYVKLSNRAKKFTPAGVGRIAGYAGDCSIGDFSIQALRGMTPEEHFVNLRHPLSNYPREITKSDSLDGYVITRWGDLLVTQNFGNDWIQAPRLARIGSRIAYMAGMPEDAADALWRAGHDHDTIFRVCAEMYPNYVTPDYDCVVIPQSTGKIPRWIEEQAKHEGLIE